MSPNRAGTALLLCLALATFAVMVAFAFLRSASRYAMSGRSELATALAREAAQSGLTHATEQILADYNCASLDIGSANGKATITSPPTFLDGPFRAPFVSLSHPNKLLSTENYTTELHDDVPEENHMLCPHMAPGDATYNWWHDSQSGYENTSHFEGGCLIYDARGRYYEANYYDFNTSRSAPTAANPSPITTIRFTDPAAPVPTGISRGLFLDDSFRRLTTGTPSDQRTDARYRLRYAIGVEDLGGHLLINPRARMNADWTDPDNDYRGTPNLPAWIEQSAYAMDNMIGSWIGYKNGNTYACLRAVPMGMAHIVRGRGTTTNADRKAPDNASDPRQGLPATFPMMFRGQGVKSQYNRWHGYHVSESPGSYKPPIGGLGGRLYNWDNSADTRFASVTAKAAGGEVITPIAYLYEGWSSSPLPWTFTYSHSLMGPMTGFYQTNFALQGARLPDGNNIKGDMDIAEWDQAGGNYFTNESWADGFRSQLNTIYSPFGRSLAATLAWCPSTSYRANDWCESGGRIYRCAKTGVSSAGSPPSGTGSAITDGTARWDYLDTQKRWYHGRVSTPYHVNLLTAPPQVISQMLLAYIPPELKTLLYSRLDKYKRIRIDSFTDAWGKPYTKDAFDSSPYESTAISKNVVKPALDILTDLVGSGFSEFPAPASTDPGGATVKPDYFQNPPDSRPIANRYPGPLCRGDSANPDEGSDNLGKDIDVDSGYEGQGMTIARCTTTQNPLLFFGGGDMVSVYDLKTPPGINDRIMEVTRIDPDKYVHKYSYFWDLTYAMTSTLSYARATWVQYPTTVFDPNPASANFGFVPADLRDPAACQTIEQIDALFLRQLGENFATPGTTCPQRPIVSNRTNYNSPIRFSLAGAPVSNTIRSLVTGDLLGTTSGVSSVERGKVMERMLNDYRMSFLGSSPDYADFRPLDFDGDTHVQCSCYAPNDLATPEEAKYHTDRWTPVEADGRGPAPTPYTKPVPAYTGTSPWFTVSGCFYIGKSHFYRIFVRGEVYDNLLRKPIATQNLESVLAVDPEAPAAPAPGRVSAEQRLLFQRWHHNPNTSELPRQVK